SDRVATPRRRQWLLSRTQFTILASANSRRRRAFSARISASLWPSSEPWRSRSSLTHWPKSPSPTPSSLATCAIGRPDSMTSLAASCRYSGVYFFLDELTMNILSYGHKIRTNWVSTTRGQPHGFVVGLGLQRLIRRLLPRIPVFGGGDEVGALSSIFTICCRRVEPIPMYWPLC